eukprot:m.39872 g.39872  ORF g.39872 m.39872 type:complete len:692 (+) comp14765_c0_seq1:111-2186(+)
MSPMHLNLLPLSIILPLVFLGDARHPPPPPPPPNCFSFNSTQSHNMVLQRGPSCAAVYGILGNTSRLPTVNVTVKDKSSPSTEYTVTATISDDGNGWKAVLRPASGGGNFTITATCNGCTNGSIAVLENVTFGDVWYCAGQSNMWLPMRHTFSRNETIDSIRAGKYNNIRLMAGNSQDSTTFPWRTALEAISDGNASVPSYALFNFSGACWYFGQKLTDLLENDMSKGSTSNSVTPIGLISTAIGGSMIESWIPDDVRQQCTNTSNNTANGVLYDAKVVPYLGMTVKGFLWYQGENDMHQLKGNSLHNAGYGCELPLLVRHWRQQWSVTPGTTDPLAPFGTVTLPGSGAEGGFNMGIMRWAQTGNYGVLPNPIMPNTFLAQGYDLDDPWGDKTCLGYGCCRWGYNATTCFEKTNGNTSICAPYCEVLQDTSIYMGPIHPRDKYPIGERLAIAAHGVVYGGSKAFTGPTVSGCSVSGTSLTVTFNTTLLRGDSVVVQPYNASAGMSQFQVLTNRSLFCLEPALRCQVLPNGTRPSVCRSVFQEWYCPASTDDGADRVESQHALDGSASDRRDTPSHPAAVQVETVGLQGTPPHSPFERAWVTVPISISGSNAIVANLSSLQGVAPVAVRYAAQSKGPNCCDDGSDPSIGKSTPCAIQKCPIMSSSGLPANPFFAQIQGLVCACVAPQTCTQA